MQGKLLGRLPNHQAMLFPRSFAEASYDESLRISADLDLKLRLHAQGSLVRQPTAVVSSMVAGISAAPLSPCEAFARASEVGRVFDRHFTWIHSKLLTVLYALNFAVRIRRWM